LDIYKAPIKLKKQKLFVDYNGVVYDPSGNIVDYINQDNFSVIAGQFLPEHLITRPYPAAAAREKPVQSPDVTPPAKPAATQPGAKPQKAGRAVPPPFPNRVGYDSESGKLHWGGSNRWVFGQKGPLGGNPVGEDFSQGVGFYRRNISSGWKDRILATITRDDSTGRARFILSNQVVSGAVKIHRHTVKPTEPDNLEVKKGESQEIKPGDRIEIGDFIFTFAL
jgi:hypothetical protein